MKGATINFRLIFGIRNISIRAPNERSDLPQSHSRLVLCISIRAPNERSDNMIDSDEMKTLKFQSALPMKGATFKIASVKAYFGISIRAPNERSDSRSRIFQMLG